MRVQLQYFSRLRDLSGPETAELAPQSTVRDLLDQLYRTVPGLKDWDKYLLVAVGLDYADRGRILENGETVSLMPPVQGG
jgi:molybdopterin converting factor small subunit